MRGWREVGRARDAEGEGNEKVEENTSGRRATRGRCGLRGGGDGR